MIVIEQNVERGLALADHVAVLEKGRVALAGPPSEMRADDRLLSLYVGEAKGNEPVPPGPVPPGPVPPREGAARGGAAG
jgi:ABC-type transporter Mla maintaining outer membrane lipid asymmetry ATPase subunit MlaF